MGERSIELDLRKIGMMERPSKIFNAWNALEKGASLVLTNDHDPKPLQFMLKAKSKDPFNWRYIKEGPDEWIVEIGKISSESGISSAQREKREVLKRILKKLHEARPDELEAVKKEAAKYFKDTEPKELALAEQELIQEGTTRQEMKRLCDVHLEVMKERLGRTAKALRLPPFHPISICKDEHKIIKHNLKKLKNTLEKLKKSTSFNTAKRQIDTLKELSHFFLETEKHHQREEEAIFPRLEAHGVVEPPQIFKEDHVEFMAKKKALRNAVMNENQAGFSEFLETVGPIIEFLTKNLEEHIYKEDNILYPMAYETLGKGEWKDVRKKFDAIGYCCFAPADLKKSKKKTTKKRK